MVRSCESCARLNNLKTKMPESDWRFCWFCHKQTYTYMYSRHDLRFNGWIFVFIMAMIFLMYLFTR